MHIASPFSQVESARSNSFIKSKEANVVLHTSLSRDVRPNITGTLLGSGVSGNESSLFTGAFARTGSYNSKTYGSAGGYEKNNNLADFKAERSSNMYGLSSTFQPRSSYSLIIIKE